MDAPRVVLIILIIIFIFGSPESQPPSPFQQLEIKALIEVERHNLDVLNGTQYDDFDPVSEKWLNITGLRRDDGYAWDLLSAARTRAQQQATWLLQHGQNPYLGERYKSIEALDNVGEARNGTIQDKTPVPFYQNLTGQIRGKWIKSKGWEDRRPTPLNLTKIAPTARYVTHEFTRNITGHEGDLVLDLREKKSEVAWWGQEPTREIVGIMSITDNKVSSQAWDVRMYGVHFPKSGSVLLTTTSNKFAGVFALPHLVRSESMHALTQRLLNSTLARTIDQQEASLYIKGNPWSSSPADAANELLYPIPRCEFVIYLQHAITSYSKGDGLVSLFPSLKHLEQELRYPTGAPLGEVPKLQMSATIFSPDCGFMLESKGPPEVSNEEGSHLQGKKFEMYLRETQFATQLYTILILLQLWLLIRQMRDTSTPSTRSRISFYTIAMMAMADGFVWMSFMAISMLTDILFLIMITIAFLSFICVSFFGMKFLMDIWSVQAPERQERQRRIAAQAAASAQPSVQPTAASQTVNTAERNGPVSSIVPIFSGAGADTLPLPVTAPRPTDTGATPVIILPPDQDIDAAIAEDEAQATATTATRANPNPQATQTTLGSARREMGALYSRFYFVLMGLAFLSVNATGWPHTIRSIYSNVLGFVYLSFWIPQIRRNIVRNCRKAFRWEFVVGQSVLRLAPFVYLYMYEDNPLYVETDQYAALVLIGWVWLQFLVLVSQEILGPRFFIPNGWAPPAYDYHPVLREDDEESGATLPLGFTEATAGPDSPTDSKLGAARTKGARIFDCAICMQNIDVHVLPAEGGDAESSASLGAGILNRRSYMVTPCRHIFHSACLEGWMKFRLQCPICRESLPPL